ncbi:MAG TPA: hypothetical protein VFK32_02735 [Tepidiformaceae bacterium]|nr:hypothetical protein [Tepidiformaceae bacterium]
MTVFMVGLAAGAFTRGHLATSAILVAAILMRLVIGVLDANPSRAGRPRLRTAAIATGLAVLTAAIATFLLG